MDNPERLATQGTQDEEKQNKNTTHMRPTRDLIELQNVQVANDNE